MKKTFRIIKGVISYILALALTIVFALFLNASVGWFMLIALILAPILSVFFALLTKSSLSIECNMESVKLSKGDSCEMRVTLKNKTIFPSTPIELNILNGDGVASEDEGIITTIMPMSTKAITIKFNANICGKSEIGIKELRVSDYLGLFSYVPKSIKDKALTQIVYVIPDVAMVSPKDERILRVMQESLNGEDSEDTKESTINTFGGFPGYDKREYVPGDPIKRINWKQSAKRNKLLVRLDDEMNASGVNVVLDGYFNREKLPEGVYAPMVAQDAVENALGIIKILVMNDYSVDFYARFEEGFTLFEIEDEKDVENLRMQMAEYGFSDKAENRFPGNEFLEEDAAYVLVTPNSGEINVRPNISVFSALDELEEKSSKGGKKSFVEVPKAIKPKFKDKLLRAVKDQSLAYCLALILSVIVFDAFEVTVLSGWTLLQAVIVVLLFMLCNFARKHKFLGFLAITGTVVISLMMAGSFMTPVSSFLEWFLSGGENYEGSIRFYMVLICFLTLFFAMVVYYYTLVQYRTSVLLLISMIAFLVHIKLVKNVEIIQVMLVVALNVAAFLISNRHKRDTGKRMVGRLNWILSLLLYSVMFILLAFAIPKSSNTKYYSEFEDRFLGGNSEVEVPSDYVGSSQFSGNADNIQTLNMRKLYAVTGLEKEMTLYLHRSTYDYYDYKENHWVIYDENYNRGYEYKDWVGSYRDIELNLEKLVEAIKKAEELSPGIVEKYNMDKLVKSEIVDEKIYAEVKTYNFESKLYVFPIRGKVFEHNEPDEQEKIFVTVNGDYQCYGDWLSKDNVYQIEFYDEFTTRNKWIELGGANYNYEDSLEMLKEVMGILSDNNEDELLNGVYDYVKATNIALDYADSYQQENEKIPDSVRELAEEITKDCTYDWEKAQALMLYFDDGFKYQLGYDAPDDSVEYFLFEGKRGTCSDFASAYVLMARSVGLITRYVEGYATDNSTNALDGSIDLIVRASDSHAYAEVFIPNYGYTVYDPTLGDVMQSLVPEEDIDTNALVVTYVLTLGARIIIIFAAVSVVLLMIILIVKVFSPMVQEKSFIKKVRKSKPGDGIVMLYIRLQEKCGLITKHTRSKTPYEFAREFEAKTGYDISTFMYLVEGARYQERELARENVEDAIRVYKEALEAYKEVLNLLKKTVNR